jgi:hypothetical protein
MFASPTVKQSGSSLHVEHGNDNNLYVEFRMEPIHQEYKSNEAGRPIFADMPFIKIMFPGDKTKVVDRPVEESDKHRFRPQWEAFERQSEQVTSGTPITEWTALTRSEAMELKALNIHTVDALAALPDTSLSWLGARDRREQAKAFLERAKGNSVDTKLMARIEKLESDNTALKNELAARNSEAKKPGRPPKQTED